MFKLKSLLKLIPILLITLLPINVVFADLHNILQNMLPFTDVSQGTWYYADVNIAYKNKLINGKTDTLFAPEDNMTAAEAVKLASCMHQLKNEGTVSLSSGAGTWYNPYVDYAKEKGLIDVDLDWNKKITRAGYMQIFARLITDEEARLNNVPDDSIPDVKMSHPSADSIYRLYRAGVVQGVDSNRNCRPASYIKRSEVATILTRMMDVSHRLQEFKITKEPEDTKAVLGTRVELKVEVSGGKAPLSYQWEYLDEESGDFKKSTSEGNTTDTLKAPVEEIVYKYRCVITDATGEKLISKKAKVEKSTMAILTNPSDFKGNLGDMATLIVAATGEAPFTFQWQYIEAEGSEYKNSEAIGNKTNTLEVAVEEQIYYYRCVIRDALGNEVISKAAKVERK